MDRNPAVMTCGLESPALIACSGGRFLTLGSLEFVGPFEPRGWKPAGTLVPLADIGWSLWLLALGVGLLVTA